jgi:excisionase family DNA binding protein
MVKLLTISEVADTLCVQERTLRIWIRDGKISALKLPNGEWRMTEENLQGWLKKRMVKATAV